MEDIMNSEGNVPWNTGVPQTSLTGDQKMFIARWRPIFGDIYCAKEIGVASSTIQQYAVAVGIPSSNTEYEMTVKEIAEKLDITEIEVQNIFNAGMCKLREAFRKRNED